MVTPWFPTADAPESGLFVAREAAALGDAHDVRVLHLDWSGRRDRESRAAGSAAVRRLALTRANPLDYLRARRAVRLAAADADILHTHALTGLLPWLRGRPAPVPWVHSEHWSALTAPDTLGPFGRLALAVLAPALRGPDVAVAECERLAAALRTRRSGPVAIVPCIVPPPGTLTPRPPGAPALIGIGGLIDRKDPLLAVETLAVLRERGLDARLTWVGEGPLRAAVATRAQALGLSDLVTLRGSLTSEEVARAIDESSMLVLPTRADNFCVVAAESLTRGRPIVSGDQTGAVDYAHPSVSRFVSERSASAFADAVESVLRESSKLTAEEISETVRDRFSPASVSTALTGIYAQVHA